MSPHTAALGRPAHPGRARGGRGGCEPRLLIRTREARVLELSTRGWSQRAIASELGISQPAVSKILQRTEDRALATLHRDRVRLIVRHLRQREHLYAQAHQGWDRSCSDRERRTQRRTTTPDGRSTTMVALHREARAGDPRFLSLMLRAVTDIGTTFRLADMDWIAIADARERPPQSASAGRQAARGRPVSPARSPEVP